MDLSFWQKLLGATGLVAALSLMPGVPARTPAPGGIDPLTGPRSRLSRDWLGLRPLPADTEILVLAGHADSQGIAGAGTGGEAVDLLGAAPMQTGIRDELHWNLLTARAVVDQGRRRGLAIRFYEPPLRTIHDADDPRTNWSVGKTHVEGGGYALEIHYDAYGPDGVGSGLIPPLHRPPSRLDESLAAAFGDYPLQYRGGLGAPRRGIAILEIGKLEGSLESALRDPRRSEAAIAAIAARVVQALERGLGRTPEAGTPAVAQESSAAESGEEAGPAILSPLTPPPGVARSGLRVPRRPASSVGE
jgi:hypothetical protein